MSLKGLSIITVVLLLAVGAGLGIPVLQNRLFPEPAPSESPTAQPDTSPAPVPLNCQESDECTWFTKIVEHNPGQPNEELEVILTCANRSYTDGCGPDCEDRGTIHPSNKIDKCLCNQGLCESEEKAPLE